MRYFYLAIVLTFGNYLSAQPDFKAIEKSFQQLEENTYINAFEVSNLEYRLFLDHVKENDPKVFEKAVYDSTRWSETLTYYRPFQKYYHSHREYNDFPAVNMTQEGARLYCQWLTEQYIAWPNRKYHEVHFRLPTEQEWKSAITDASQHQSNGEWLERIIYEDFQDEEGRPTANFKQIPQSSLKVDPKTGEITYVPVPKLGDHCNTSGVTAIVESYGPNEIGCYNLQGNVAEWVEEVGLTKGGSYHTTGWYLLPDSRMEVDPTKGHPDVGFRVVMEVRAR